MHEGSRRTAVGPFLFIPSDTGGPTHCGHGDGVCTSKVAFTGLILSGRQSDCSDAADSAIPLCLLVTKVVP